MNKVDDSLRLGLNVQSALKFRIVCRDSDGARILPTLQGLDAAE